MVIRYEFIAEDGKVTEFALLSFALELAMASTGKTVIKDYVNRCEWRFSGGFLLGKYAFS